MVSEVGFALLCECCHAFLAIGLCVRDGHMTQQTHEAMGARGNRHTGHQTRRVMRLERRPCLRGHTYRGERRMKHALLKMAALGQRQLECCGLRLGRLKWSCGGAKAMQGQASLPAPLLTASLAMAVTGFELAAMVSAILSGEVGHAPVHPSSRSNPAILAS